MVSYLQAQPLFCCRASGIGLFTAGHDTSAADLSLYGLPFTVRSQNFLGFSIGVQCLTILLHLEYNQDFNPQMMFMNFNRMIV